MSITQKFNISLTNYDLELLEEIKTKINEPRSSVIRRALAFMHTTLFHSSKEKPPETPQNPGLTD